MLRVKRWRAVGFAVLSAVATFPCARAGEAHIKYVYELGASPNDGANAVICWSGSTEACTARAAP